MQRSGLLGCAVDLSKSCGPEVVRILAMGDLLFGCDVVKRLIALECAADCEPGAKTILGRPVGSKFQRRSSIERPILNEDKSVTVRLVQARAGLHIDGAASSSARLR